MSLIDEAAKEYCETNIPDLKDQHLSIEMAFEAGAEFMKKLAIDKLKITSGAIILDGYEADESCIVYLQELAEEIEEIQ